MWITVYTYNVHGAVVVAQLVERSLPIPEVRGSNPVIGKIYWTFFTVNCIEKTKIKKKEARNGPFLKTFLQVTKNSEKFTVDRD